MEAMSNDRATRSRGPLALGLADWLFDRPAFWGVLEWWLPLSRMWAAALEARGDIETFKAAAPAEAASSLMLSRLLAGVDRSRRRYEAIDRAWREEFFAPGAHFGASLADLERRRSRAAFWLTAQRLRFAPLRPLVPVPPVRFRIPSPASAAAVYGPDSRAAAALYAPPPVLPAVEQSRRILISSGEDCWLRFASPSARMGDTAWARVHAPRGIVDPPTLIFGNGVFIEPDHLGRPSGDVQRLVRRGLRVIEIESPWHGRRRRAGFYGGEPFFATAPHGTVDLFTAQAQELAVLVDWCRRTSRGAVAFGGASMGALAAALAAAHARHWPERLRPDALALITVADAVADLAFESSLANRIGLPQALAAAGWTKEDTRRWRPLTALPHAPPLPPHRIVIVLGEADRILPYAMGRRLAERWGVPPDNLFVGGGGHFATQMGVVWDQRPIGRLAHILRGLGPAR